LSYRPIDPVIHRVLMIHLLQITGINMML